MTDINVLRNLHPEDTGVYMIEGRIYTAGELVKHGVRQLQGKRFTLPGMQGKDWTQYYEIFMDGKKPPASGASSSYFPLQDVPEDLRTYVATHALKINKAFTFVMDAVSFCGTEEDDNSQPLLVTGLPVPVPYLYPSPELLKRVSSKFLMQQFPADRRSMNVIVSLVAQNFYPPRMATEIMGIVEDYAMGCDDVQRVYERLRKQSAVNGIAITCALSSVDSNELRNMYRSFIRDVFETTKANLRAPDGSDLSLFEILGRYSNDSLGDLARSDLGVLEADGPLIHMFNLNPKSSAGLFYQGALGEIFDFDKYDYVNSNTGNLFSNTAKEKGIDIVLGKYKENDEATGTIVVMSNWVSVLNTANRVITLLAKMNAGEFDEEARFRLTQELTCSKAFMKMEAIKITKPARLIWAANQFVQILTQVLFKLVFHTATPIDEGGMFIQSFNPFGGGLLKTLQDITEVDSESKVRATIYSDNLHFVIQLESGRKIWFNLDAEKMEASHTRYRTKVLCEVIAEVVFDVDPLLLETIGSLGHKGLSVKVRNLMLQKIRKNKKKGNKTSRLETTNWNDIGSDDEEEPEHKDKNIPKDEKSRLGPGMTTLIAEIVPLLIDSPALYGGTTINTIGMPSGIGPTYALNSALMGFATWQVLQNIKESGYQMFFEAKDDNGVKPNEAFFEMYESMGIKLKLESVVRDVDKALGFQEPRNQPVVRGFGLLGFDLLDYGDVKAPCLERTRLLKSMIFQRPPGPNTQALEARLINKMAAMGRNLSALLNGAMWDEHLSTTCSLVLAYAKLDLKRTNKQIGEEMAMYVGETLPESIRIELQTTVASLIAKKGVTPPILDMGAIVLDQRSFDNFVEKIEQLSGDQAEAMELPTGFLDLTVPKPTDINIGALPEAPPPFTPGAKNVHTTGLEIQKELTDPQKEALRKFATYLIENKELRIRAGTLFKLNAPIFEALMKCTHDKLLIPQKMAYRLSRYLVLKQRIVTQAQLEASRWYKVNLLQSIIATLTSRRVSTLTEPETNRKFFLLTKQ